MCIYTHREKDDNKKNEMPTRSPLILTMHKCTLIDAIGGHI